jgi:hypothetical protein
MAVYPTLPYVPSGFYEDKWCKCDWCSKWGMSLWPPVLPAGVLSLIDIDGLGYLCDACYDLAEPPHGTPMLDSGAHNHWSASCQNHYVATPRCWRPYLLLWFGMMRDACGGEHPAAHSSVTNVTTISFHADKDVFAVYSGMICAWKNYCLAAISSNSTNSN